MPLAGLLALASLAGALVWASSAGAVVLSGVPCKGNASISGSVLVSAPVLGEVCNTAKPRFHHGHPRSAWVGSDFVGTSRSSLASQGCARTRPMSKSASQTSLSVAVAVRGNSASKGGRIAPGLGFSTACALIPIGFMLLASGGGAQRTPSLPRLAVRFGLAICFRLSVPGIQRVIGCFLPTGFSSYVLRQGLVVFCLLLASDFIVWDPRCLDGELRI